MANNGRRHGPGPGARHRRARTLPVAAALVMVGAVGAACGSSTPASSSIPAPKGLPGWYSVPLPLPKAPGTLLKDQVVAAGGLHGTVYRVMYTSESVLNKIVAVTGLVIVPDTPAPAGGYPVVSWGHGTNGMADQCAPSLDPTQAVPMTNGLLDQGWEVTASDYQGEGTPGLLPYIVGVSAARNTIDIVRAALQMKAAHASHDYVVWGHSEGGQTAMFTLKIGSSYAPDLRMRGVVAGAPPSQFGLIYQFLSTSPFRYYLFMVAGAYQSAYGPRAAPLSEVLTPLGVSLLPDLDKGCSDYLSTVIDKYTIAQITTGDPFKIPAWKTLIMANDPENFGAASSVPLLIIQGGSDEQIPVASTQLLAHHLCGVGQDLERWIYPGQSHAGVIGPSFDDMVHWIKDRFAGVADPDTYAPTGLAGIQTTTCS
ncbi:MAG TPA: lipase family protein [Acidimicrobiales bacterium]|nr:lipase family protein [Acidimicrobiales bacterium]